MTYTQITMDELVIIEAYFHQNTPVSKMILQMIGCARQTAHNVITHFRDGRTTIDTTFGTSNSVARHGLCCPKTSRYISKKKWPTAGR